MSMVKKTNLTIVPPQLGALSVINTKQCETLKTHRASNDPKK
jgi:hypothetical protein